MAYVSPARTGTCTSRAHGLASRTTNTHTSPNEDFAVTSIVVSTVASYQLHTVAFGPGSTPRQPCVCAGSGVTRTASLRRPVRRAASSLPQSNGGAKTTGALAYERTSDRSVRLAAASATREELVQRIATHHLPHQVRRGVIVDDLVGRVRSDKRRAPCRELVGGQEDVVRNRLRQSVVRAERVRPRRGREEVVERARGRVELRQRRESRDLLDD